MVTAEKLRTQGSKNEGNRRVLVNGRRRFKKIREEEENLKNITEELQEERRIQEGRSMDGVRRTHEVMRLDKKKGGQHR